MKKPEQALSIIKDFCPVSGVEVEKYINRLESQLEKAREGFKGLLRIDPNRSAYYIYRETRHIANQGLKELTDE